MVQVSFPGVYVQEVPSGARTITGVSTAVAAFVGMAKRGPVGVPKLVLGFTDYVRNFSDDVSQGEMTDQVRQFFLNGGQQAFIVRVAGPPVAPATLTLTGVANGTQLKFKAVSQGKDGNLLRATIDYATSSPERTFNLTIFREVTDANGNVSVQESELHKDLSMDPLESRFVVTVLANDSALVTAEATGTGTGGAIVAEQSFSISGTLSSNFLTTITNAIGAVPGNPGFGKFRLRLGNNTPVTIPIFLTDLTTVANLAADLTAVVNLRANLAPGTITVATPGTTDADAGDSESYLVFTHPSLDVVLDRATDSDIAVALGLGVAQGGIELGAFRNSRPAPNGFASTLEGASPADTSPITALLNFGNSKPVFTTTTKMKKGTVSTVSSLLNVRQNLQAIAKAINDNLAAAKNWHADLAGYRLTLKFVGGSSSSGGGHSFTTVPAASLGGIAATGGILVPALATSKIAGSPFDQGNDGSNPRLEEYRTAFEEIDRQVDIFNILMLPKSAAAPDNRESFWGGASSFALSRRAFLLIDAPSSTDTVLEARDKVVDLRIGIVKDHSALYWPRLKVDPDGNPRSIDPSGSIAGIMARIDSNRGVWKAPAGIEADVRGILGVAVPMSDPENGLLNPRALNAIRVFPNGIVSWGARTMDGFDNSGNDDYKYVPVRRFALFLEESLVRGLKFAVFEPNDEPLWGQIRLTVGAFLNNLFRQGAFAGKTTRDAYFVKVDSETTTQNDINLGIVNVIVGFAPLKPAEFVVITIKQKAGQVQV